jgi:hypothetical protein
VRERVSVAVDSSGSGYSGSGYQWQWIQWQWIQWQWIPVAVDASGSGTWQMAVVASSRALAV